MPQLRTTAWTFLVLALLAGQTLSKTALAEDEDEGYLTEESKEPAKESGSSQPQPAKPKKRSLQKRKYFTDQSPRTDAGVFHVAATLGGNFYIEPEVNASLVPTGNYHKDFGFAAGVTFDYDYSELDENIPLCLRGFIGYKYVLNSVHVATFDGIVRRMWRFSEKSSFGLGFGGSAAVWYRVEIPSVSTEEIIFLPSFIMEAGFDFNPFMIDLRLLINRIKGDSSIMGGELYFGFRL
jgi:hypothetical protein